MRIGTNDWRAHLQSYYRGLRDGLLRAEQGGVAHAPRLKENEIPVLLLPIPIVEHHYPIEQQSLAGTNEETGK